MLYDYENGIANLRKIIDSKIEIQTPERISDPGSIATFENGVRTWVCSIFVDIVDSTHLFTNDDLKDKTKAKILRCFFEGIVDILYGNKEKQPIDSGIRGDAAYAVYSTPTKDEFVDVFRIAFTINTYIKMINKLFEQKQWPTIRAGIGLSSSQDLIIKVGKKRKDSDFVWIGSCLVEANKLSKIANRDGFDPIAMSNNFYFNIIEPLKKINSNYSKWINKRYSNELGDYLYECSIINSTFNEWINNNL